MLEALELRAPDLILLDVLMPHLDGFQLLERLKADDRYADLPVLIVSSLPAEEATVRTLGLGAADFIRKPFRVRDLLARIQAQLRNRAERRNLGDVETFHLGPGPTSGRAGYAPRGYAGTSCLGPVRS